MRTGKDLYDVIGDVLKKDKKKPWTAVQLYELAEIKKFAANSNRVSDYMGNMWRKGALVRLPAPRVDGEASRWMYQWKGAAMQKPDLTKAVEYRPKKVLLARPQFDVTEVGDVITIETNELCITIKPKQPGGKGLPD